MARGGSFVLFAFALTFVAVPTEVRSLDDTPDTAEKVWVHDLGTDLVLIYEATADFHDVEAPRADGREVRYPAE